MLIYALTLLEECMYAPSHQEVIAYVFTIAAGKLVGHVLELQTRETFVRRQELISTAHHSRRADSRLNHVIKNKSAEARFLVEEVADGLKTIKQALRLGQPDKIFVARLLDSLACVQYIHEQTVDWTHLRELFMQIQHGIYQPRNQPTDLMLLLKRVFGDDAKQALNRAAARQGLELWGTYI